MFLILFSRSYFLEWDLPKVLSEAVFLIRSAEQQLSSCSFHLHLYILLTRRSMCCSVCCVSRQSLHEPCFPSSHSSRRSADTQPRVQCAFSSDISSDAIFRSMCDEYLAAVTFAGCSWPVSGIYADWCLCSRLLALWLSYCDLEFEFSSLFSLLSAPV